MKKYKILWGICGIGNGHTQRQLPLIEHFIKNSRIVIFAYDSSYKFFIKYFSNNPNIRVLEVAVPFYVGNKEGIDFEATEKLDKNHKDYTKINDKARVQAEEIIGTPDLVISDYEPISAEYAYKHNASLITVDQQSKYLVGEFPKELHNETYADEVARLKLFFPTACARLACSFFDVVKNEKFPADVNTNLVGVNEVNNSVLMFPPILKDSILDMQNTPTAPTSLLVYFSSQKEFPQSLEEVIGVCATKPEVQFHIFVPNIEDDSLSGYKTLENINLYKHGDEGFPDILKNCSGIISTAGHTLLSEAMCLGIPVYAIPLAVYEQQMNAEVIDKNKFGICSTQITSEKLSHFISNLSHFRSSIKADKTVLLRGNGREKVIEFIESKLNPIER